MPETLPDATGWSPVDPDVDLHVPRPRRDLDDSAWPVVGVIAAGGVLGAVARHGLTVSFPHRPGGFAWATFGINVSGCLLIGVLMVMIEQVWGGRRLVRPFLGVGVLGGFTTYSSYVLDANQAVAAGAAGTALAYLAGTLVAALAAVWVGASATWWLVGIGQPHPHHEGTAR